MNSRLDRADESVFEQSEWTLAALLPAHEGPELDRIVAELEAQLREFEAYRGRLSTGMSVQTLGG
ncbi:MAG: hypothetical protein PVH41_09670 [Anaerolineae bacterium]|jgi:hypothetical protein